MSRATDITNRIWDMANSLRGSMDASEYKNYILPFLFYRYLSEKQDAYIKKNMIEEYYEIEGEELEEYKADILKGLGYVINPEYRWEKIIDDINNHEIQPSLFSDMFQTFKDNAEKNEIEANDFTYVFSDVSVSDSRLGSDINEKTKSLMEIVEIIDSIAFKDENGRDILGDIYEYLIGLFAANAGKKGGEFYTPHEVSKVLAKIVTSNYKDDGRQFNVYDPAMGSGSLLLTVQKELPNGKEKGTVNFYGQEKNQTTFNMARMNLMMHDVDYRNMHLNCADTLVKDWPMINKDGVETPLIFDAVVANPPYSAKWDITTTDRSKDERFKKYGVAPASKADYAFVLHSLYHLDRNGTMAIVLPHGVLFRGAKEKTIRENLIKSNKLDTVIGLPANMFYGTSIPTCILVFKGADARGDLKDILFIDASDEFEKVKKQNKLTKENIEKIVNTYRNREEIEKYSHIATLDEIEENEYNLNIPRYVDKFEKEEVKPIPEIAKEMSEVDSEIESLTKEIMGLFMDLDGTTDEAKKELEDFKKIMKW